MLAEVEQTIDLRNLDKSDWKSYRFDEIAHNISERIDPNNTDLEVYIGLEHIDSESIHIKRFGTRDDVNGQKLRFYPGDVIFGRRRAYQRKAGIAETNGFCSAHALVLRANPEVIDPNLFSFFMHSDAFMHRAIDISVGSLSPTINWGTLKKQEFLLPPLEQHKKLADLFWTLDEALQSFKSNLDKLISARSAYLKYSLPKYSALMEMNLPDGYEVKRLDELADISGGSTPSRDIVDYWGGEIPWLTPTDVTKHDGIWLSDTKEKITISGLKSISNKLYPPGSILYCSRATIGYSVINKVPMTTNQGFTNFICKSNVRNIFLYFLLEHITPELTRLAGGSTFLEISKSAIRNFKVIVPNDKDREAIEARLLIFDDVYHSLCSKIEFSKQLAKKLINQVF